MSREKIDQAYGRRRVVASGAGFRSVDTLFEIPECHLYATLVDGLDEGRIPGKDCFQVFQDVRWAIDSAHRNGEMKAEILANPEFYILRDPQLAGGPGPLEAGREEVVHPKQQRMDLHGRRAPLPPRRPGSGPAQTGLIISTWWW